MKKEIEKPEEDFVSYEEARIEKPETEATDNITDEEVEAANEILHPDDNSMDSRG
ncbi:hypothetical protein GGR21_002935 [Dysgonomonas hofstadii]|uniref:Uncharacterized protein n=1 Tax=Dysgonomonas hofstadii TaxID=637886 RepID=A0A840CPN4_9BACT|nr:hypothetical protein [Dysgonomonas hofstadii]MBB4037021.1 hypothetical protein [Dysgonomonas hofstadii]